MIMTPVDDGARAVLRAVHQVQLRDPAPKRTPNAEASARYRARKRGEPVPKRKPGPKPPTEWELRQQANELRRQLADQTLLLQFTRDQLARRRNTSTRSLPIIADELITILREQSPRQDSPEDRAALRLLIKELHHRHQLWPRS
ncbi:MAG: hypothetical protein M3460_13360 [Actinomycetota bacterium]|nr:hypothetical protein [Actinomycetota bacterium]